MQIFLDPHSITNLYSFFCCPVIMSPSNPVPTGLHTIASASNSSLTMFVNLLTAKLSERQDGGGTSTTPTTPGSSGSDTINGTLISKLLGNLSFLIFNSLNFSWYSRVQNFLQSRSKPILARKWGSIQVESSQLYSWPHLISQWDVELVAPPQKRADFGPDEATFKEDKSGLYLAFVDNFLIGQQNPFTWAVNSTSFPIAFQ